MLPVKRGALGSLLPGRNKANVERKRRSNPIFHDIGHMGRKTGIQVKNDIRKDEFGFDDVDEFFDTSTPQEHVARTGRKIKKAKAVPSTLAKPLASRDVNLRVDPTTPYVAAADTKKRLDLSVITPKPSAELVKALAQHEETDAPATTASRRRSVRRSPVQLDSQEDSQESRPSSLESQESHPASPSHEHAGEEAPPSTRSTGRKRRKTDTSEKDIVVVSAAASPAPASVSKSSRTHAKHNVKSPRQTPDSGRPSTPDIEEEEPVQSEEEAAETAAIDNADMDMDIEIGGYGGDMDFDLSATHDNDMDEERPQEHSEAEDGEEEEEDEDLEITLNLGRRESISQGRSKHSKKAGRRFSYFPDEEALDDENEEEDDDDAVDSTFNLDVSTVGEDEQSDSDQEQAEVSFQADKSFIEELKDKDFADDDIDVDEHGNPTRRSRRVRTNTLRYWANERQVLQKRRSGGIELKGIVRGTDQTEPAPKDKKKGPRYSMGTELRKAGFAEKTNPKVLVKVGNTERPMEIARTPQMINLVSLDGNEPGEPGVLVGKAFSRPGFASGVMHIPPMTAKENANTGSNTLVIYVISGKVTVTVNRTDMYMTAGSHFFIPKGNQYILANQERSSTAKLVFFQNKEGGAHDSHQ